VGVVVVVVVVPGGGGLLVLVLVHTVGVLGLRGHLVV
jgi:hypothetical protein